MADRGCRILLVEDNPADIRLFQLAFADFSPHHRLDVARDGTEALDLLYERRNTQSSVRPDLVILDVNLPKRSGHEVLTAMKQDVDLRRIPVLILTTSSAEADVHRAYQEHANAYLQKPKESDEFFGLLEVFEQFWLQLVRLPKNTRPKGTPDSTSAEGRVRSRSVEAMQG